MSARLRYLLICGAVLAASLGLGVPTAQARQPTGPLLVVLSDTGSSRDGLPVLRRRPGSEAIVRVLSSGFSGRLLRLYRAEQTLLSRRDGRSVEPAYLLLSNNEGGFPRKGFFLGGAAKRDAGYVDLVNHPATGRFAALDQIFPHELLHVIVEQLAGSPKYHSTHTHEVGTQTDRSYAYQEGFAEAMQILAIDDPKAAPDTRALRSQTEYQRRADARMRDYRTELSSRATLAAPSQLAFLLWYLDVTKSQRYFAVRDNAFARQADIPEQLLRPGDPYRAYLLDNILPGGKGARPKSPGRLVATEGVVSHLLWRLCTDRRVQGSYLGQDFYSAFGLERDQVDGLDNALLKLFRVLNDRRPQDVVGLVGAYRAAQPKEAAAVNDVVHDALLGQALPTTPELWMRNRHFSTGISVLDQYRSSPRTHTFDLNAASVVDLLAVPGMSRALADAVLSHGPYRKLGDLAAVPGMTRTTVRKFQRMAADAPPAKGAQQLEQGDPISEIMTGYLYRAVGYLLLTIVCGALAQWLLRRTRWWWALLAGTAVAVTALLPAWLLPAMDVSGRMAPALVLVPLALFAVPAAAWNYRSSRDTRRSLRVLGAWAVSVTPVVLITQTWI